MKNIATKITMITSVALIVVLGLFAQGRCGGVVYPTGIYPDDVFNIQSAVSTGGMVALKATNEAGVPEAFNFGIHAYSPPIMGLESWMLHQRLLIDNGVIIKGETKKGQMATISGGYFPIFVGAISDPDGPVAIRNIRFENPGGFAIIVFVASNNVIIEGNEMVTNFYDELNSIPEAPDPYDDTDPNSLLAWEKLFFQPFDGLWNAGFVQFGDFSIPGGVSGTVMVKNNFIDFEAGAALPAEATKCWWNTYGVGAASTAGKVFFKRNEILNSSWLGIWLMDNFGDTYVQNNMLQLGPLASSALGPVEASAYGIVNWYGVNLGDGAPEVGGKTKILGNDITCDPADGIDFGLGMTGIGSYGVFGYKSADVSILNNNVVIQQHGFVGIGIADVQDGHVAHNRIAGSAWFGLAVGNDETVDPILPLPTSNNVINNNDLRDFTGEFPFMPGIDTMLFQDAVDNRVIKSGIVGGNVGLNIVH